MVLPFPNYPVKGGFGDLRRDENNALIVRVVDAGDGPMYSQVRYYNQPENTAIDAVAGELILIDLSGINDNVVVTFTGSGTEGQPIAVVCVQDNGGVNSISFAGTVTGGVEELNESGEGVAFALALADSNFPAAPIWVPWQRWYIPHAATGSFTFQDLNDDATLEPWHYYNVTGECTLTFPEASASTDNDQIVVKVTGGHIEAGNLIAGTDTTLETDPTANDVYNGRSYTWIYDANAATWRILNYYAGQVSP